MISKFVLLFAIVACVHSTPEWLLRNGLASPLLSTGVSGVPAIAPAVASAAPVATYGLAAPLLSTGVSGFSGVSSGASTQDAIGNYGFFYSVGDAVGATNYRTESGDPAGNKIGTYSLTDTDGRVRRVDYVADGLGFRASVRTNEPGTAMSAPADASIISPYAMPVAPAPVAAAPVVPAAPAVAAATPVSTYGLAAPLLSTGVSGFSGVSSGARTQDAIGNYGFFYSVGDAVGATNYRTESGDPAGNKIGTYSLTDIDGRVRRVDYVADGLGFRASVRTNEPGTAMSAPAAVSVISPYAMPVAPAPVVAAPVVAAGVAGIGQHW